MEEHTGNEMQRGDGTMKSRCDRTGNSLALKHRYTERILHHHDAHVCHTSHNACLNACTHLLHTNNNRRLFRCHCLAFIKHISRS